MRARGFIDCSILIKINKTQCADCSLRKIMQYAIKHLVNHKIPNDITTGYIVMDPERLRQPMERITEAILAAAQRDTVRPVNVIPLRAPSMNL